MPDRYLGRTLGKYRIEELIGSGGFAWVYRAHDDDLDVDVAIKILKPQFGGDPQFEERFRREATTAAKLRHPNIVNIYAVGRDGDAVYFVMDFLPDSLADQLERQAFLSEERVARIGIDVARALGFAHRNGVIHRDIKVDNVLFDSHGNAVVADFGIARAVSGYTQQTGTNMVVGTPQYFAPEQARAKPLDGRADLYSLGVTLFRTLTGKLPFDGDDWYEIARQHVESEPPAPRSINPTISREMERIVLHCLAKHPDDRPATGEVLAEELEALRARTREGTAIHGALPRGEEPRLLARPSKAVTSRRRGNFVAIFLLGTFVAAGFAARYLRRNPGLLASATPDSTAVKGPDSSAAAPLPPPATLPDTAIVARDSARADSAPSVKPVPNPALTLGKLQVRVGDNVRLSINGVAQGSGRWRADTLKPGIYTIEAAIDGPPGCESASVTRTVRVRAGALRDELLEPRSCGLLTITARNAGAEARFTLVATSGTFRREGSLPLKEPLLLPEGTYRFIAQQPRCAEYRDDDVSIGANRTNAIAFTLLCEPGASAR